MTDRHLTPDQLDDYLIDPAAAAPATVAHLAGCPACRIQLNGFHSHLAAFSQATLAWADARSATLPRVPQSVRPPWRPLLWSAGALASAALSFSVARQTAPPANEYAATFSPNQIASDNQLLANIDEAVEAPALPATTLFDSATPNAGKSRERHP